MKTLAQTLFDTFKGAAASSEGFTLHVTFVDDRAETYEAWLWEVGADFIGLTFDASAVRGDVQLIPLARFHSITIGE